MVSERMAVGFETAGWQVERYVPDESPISTALRVAAIDLYDTVNSLFGKEGGVSVIVRINSCPEFVDGRSRVKVEHFLVDPEAVATTR